MYFRDTTILSVSSGATPAHTQARRALVPMLAVVVWPMLAMLTWCGPHIRVIFALKSKKKGGG